MTLGVDNLSEALGSDVVEPKRRLGQGAEVSSRCGGGGEGDTGNGDSRHHRESSSENERGKEAGEQEQEFRDSTAFLKGTQSLNPHNDYSQNFVDTGQRPQNFIRDTGVTLETLLCDWRMIVFCLGLTNRFEEYPKLQELIRLKVTLPHEKASIL